MSFFIPGRTTCAICECAIEHRWQAAQLPFADPAEIGDLATLARRYVHRSCWDGWSARERYSQSAMSLIARSQAQLGEGSGVDQAQRIAWRDVPALKSFRVEDLMVLVTFDIAWADACRVADWLRDAVSLPTVESLGLPVETWQLRRDGGRIELVRLQADEPIEVIEVSPDRLMRWASVVGQLRDVHR